MTLEKLLENQSKVFVQQKKNWTEIVLNFETKNRYSIMNENQDVIGMIAEKGSGFFNTLKRWILRSHRGFEVSVYDHDGKPLGKLSRSFFFFFSDLYVAGAQGEPLGSIHRRFGILYKKYDLKDSTGFTFATVKSPLWRLWTFPVEDPRNLSEGAEISKKWGGALSEVFTDSDTFLVDFGQPAFPKLHKVIIFAAAISIDFDFFEKNQGISGMWDLFT